MEEIDDIVDADADGDVDVEKPTQQLETTMDEIDDNIDANADANVDVEKPTQQLETTMEKIDDSVDTVASVDETGLLIFSIKATVCLFLPQNKGKHVCNPVSQSLINNSKETNFFIAHALLMSDPATKER